MLENDNVNITTERGRRKFTNGVETKEDGQVKMMMMMMMTTIMHVLDHH
jgi:hypothetical protein